MESLKKKAIYICCLLGSAIAQTSCNTIDDDLSDCVKDYRVTLHVNTQVDDVLARRLRDADDQAIREVLRAPLHTIFSEQGHDLNIAFYNNNQEANIEYLYQQDMQGARQATYSLFFASIPYRNIALANVAEEPTIDYADTENSTTAIITNRNAITANGTIATQQSALFTARKNVFIPSDVDSTLCVDLYMANGAAVLVVDTTGVKIRDMHVDMNGTASTFNLNDSTYSFNGSPTVNTRRFDAQQYNKLAFMGLTLPSPMQPTRADEDTQSGSYWTLTVYVDKPDGTTTRSIIYVRQPLHADELLIIKAILTPDGVIETVDVDAGISIDLDWSPGGEWNTDF